MCEIRESVKKGEADYGKSSGNLDLARGNATFCAG
jgi:hypothetical protein